jgi:hypothetical protein
MRICMIVYLGSAGQAPNAQAAPRSYKILLMNSFSFGSSDSN